MNNHSRTLAVWIFAAALLLAGADGALAAVHYVDVNNANSMWPYTSWATAASGIQEVIEIAVAGDEIVVTNGTYSVGGRSTVDQSTTTNRVVVDKPLALRSVNGPQSTIIDGGGVFRCVYLTNGASLSGFTLTNGRAHSGGGLWCESTNAVVSNCVVSGNSSFGGGTYRGVGAPCCDDGYRTERTAFAGGVYGGTINNCILNGNWAADYVTYDGRVCDLSTCTIASRFCASSPCGDWFPGRGGGAVNAVLNNCTLTNNSAGYGGGSYGCTLNNCTLTGNSAVSNYGRGGGASLCTLNNCTLTDNSAEYGGGAESCTLNNCTLTCNSAIDGGGARYSTLNNCTLTGNHADAIYIDDGEGNIFPIGGYGGGTFGSTQNNCIVYFNTATYEANYSFCTLNYSCTTPLPTNGVGNITNAPLFLNPAAGNYRLRPDSPCIDAGTNLSASITNDLDGRPRPLDGNGDGLAAFDMGAYEYRTPLLVWQDSPNPTRPHADWTTAAHTIQDAVDAAFAGDEIVVTNGIYATGQRSVDGITTNRVAVDKPLTLRSVNGPETTIIDGGHVSWDRFSGSRCAYLASGASLSGFTLTNGFTYSVGGGVFCGSQTAVVSNCVVSGNVTFTGGGGAYGGTLNNCTVGGNSASADHGGGGFGGGAAKCMLNNCTVSGNSASGFGITAHGNGGGVFDSTLNSCTVTGNSADYGGGALNSTLNNCTLTGNSAIVFGGAYLCVLNNCIAHFNIGGNQAYCVLNYSCTTPMPTDGFGNITNAPLFVDTNGWSNLRLQSNSPCINAGLNGFAPAGPDLDGNPRIVVGTVDMGAYEFQSLDLVSLGVVANRFGFNITGQSNWVVVLEASSDFTNWTPLTTNTLSGSPFPFRDPAPPNLPQRFYRARLQ